MKVWLVVAIVAGLLVLGGVAVVQALDNNQVNQDVTPSSAGTYSCGAEGGSCGGGCTAGSNCGYAGCGAVSGSSGGCGCGR